MVSGSCSSLRAALTFGDTQAGAAMITAAVAAEAKSARKAAKYAQDQEKARRPSRRLVKADPRLDQEKAAEVDTGERAPEKADETLTKAAEEALEATKAANFKAESEALENRRRLKQRRLMQRPLRQRQKPPPKRPKRRLRQRQSCQREGRAGSFSESGPREGCH